MLREKTTSLELDLEQANEDLGEAQGACKVAESKVDGLESKIAHVRDTSTTEMSILKEEIRKVQEENLKKGDELSALKDEITKLREENSKNIKLHENELLRLRRTNEEEVKTIQNALNVEINTLRKSYANVSNRCSVLEVDKGKLKALHEEVSKAKGAAESLLKEEKENRDRLVVKYGEIYRESAIDMIRHKYPDIDVSDVNFDLLLLEEDYLALRDGETAINGNATPSTDITNANGDGIDNEEATHLANLVTVEDTGDAVV